MITSEELQRHLYENGRQISRRRADLEFTDVDTNQDGALSAGRGGAGRLGAAHSWAAVPCSAAHWPTAAFPSALCAGRVTAAEYLVHSLEGLPPHTADAVNAFRMPDPLDWASYVDVTLAAMVHADKGGNKGLARDEFYDFLNPEGALARGGRGVASSSWGHRRAWGLGAGASSVPVQLMGLPYRPC